MAQPFQSALPPDLELDGGTIIRITAIDPTTGNTVSGVTISDVCIRVVDIAGTGADALNVGPFMMVPGPNA